MDDKYWHVHLRHVAAEITEPGIGAGITFGMAVLPQRR